MDDRGRAACLSAGLHEAHVMLAHHDGIVVENNIVDVVRLVKHENLARPVGNIARLTLCGEGHRRARVEHLAFLHGLAEHVIGFAGAERDVSIGDLDLFFALVGLERVARHVVDRVIECICAIRRPLSGNVFVLRNGLVEVKRRLGRRDVAIFVRSVPAFQRVTGADRTRNNRLGGGVAPIGGNAFDNVVAAVADRATVQMERHLVRRRGPNGVEAHVALDGKRFAGLRPAAGVLVHRPLHVHTCGTERPALERPFLGAVLRTVGAHGGRAEGGPIGIRELPAVFARAIDLRVVLVLVIQLVAVHVLGHLRAVGQPDRTERHLAASRDVV